MINRWYHYPNRLTVPGFELTSSADYETSLNLPNWVQSVARTGLLLQFFSGPRGGLGGWENFGEQIWECTDVVYVEKLFSHQKNRFPGRKNWFPAEISIFSLEKNLIFSCYQRWLSGARTHAITEKFRPKEKLRSHSKISEHVALFPLTKNCLVCEISHEKTGGLASRQNFVSRLKCKKTCIFGLRSEIILPRSHRVPIPQQGIRHMSEKRCQTELL